MASSQRVLIVTALPVEHRAARRHLVRVRSYTYLGTTYHIGHFPVQPQPLEIVLLQTGQGNEAAGIETERALTHFEPSIAIFLGVAGGLKDVKLGDVVVAEKVHWYESGKATEAGLLSRPDTLAPSYELLSAARATADSNWRQRLPRACRQYSTTVHIAPVAAGEQILASARSVVFRWIRENCNDAIAVDKESHGFLKAAYLHASVRALVVRGISDLLNGKTESHDVKWQPVAAATAGAFTFSLLSRLAPEIASGTGSVISSPGISTTTRWSNIDCSLPPENPDFVGRQRLTEEIIRFIASHRSGYLVLRGSMGSGKTTFLAQFLNSRRARDIGDSVIYHIINYHPSQSGAPQNVAACLYERLQRKYGFEEPAAWRLLPIEDKLERLLKHLSETVLARRPTPEVLYIDAADQARGPLVPNVLRALPEGVLCIVTSRPDLFWLRMSQSVTIWNFDDYVDNRADVHEYLQRRAGGTLPNEFITEIVTQAVSPVFFTVVGRLREIEDPLTLPSLREQLLHDAALWAIAPETLVRDELMRRLDEAVTAGISESEFWRTLGLLAVAWTSLTRSQLRALGLWADGKMDQVLRLARNFFSRLSGIAADGPYRFDHPGYQREILGFLGEGAVECHRVLAEACEAGPNESSPPLRPRLFADASA